MLRAPALQHADPLSSCHGHVVEGAAAGELASDGAILSLKQLSSWTWQILTLSLGLGHPSDKVLPQGLWGAGLGG